MQRIVSLALGMFALAIMGGSAYLYFKAEQETSERWGQDGPVPVGVVEVQQERFADRIQALGTAQADESVTLTARVSETIESVHFEDGEYVEEGQILVALSRQEQIAESEQYRAALKEFEQQLERTRDLAARGNASEATLDQQIRLVEEAKAQIEGAQARIEVRVVRAPFSGILGLRRVSPGTLVSPGDEITTLDDVTPIKLDFSVPERFLSVLKPSQSVLAKAAAYPGEVFRGEISTVSSRVDPVTRAVTVRALIPNEDARLRPGMLLTVEVINRERMALSVPEEALVPEGPDQFVYVVDPQAGTAERRQVTLGQRQPGRVEILSGIERGELVVFSGTQRLRPGAPVEIVERGSIQVERPQA